MKKTTQVLSIPRQQNDYQDKNLYYRNGRLFGKVVETGNNYVMVVANGNKIYQIWAPGNNL